MANNNDDSRRDPPRPEDNPFIAFRRFADSQVSSLLNTVFTLPATIANYSNAHQAREKCLFGKADQRQCEKLDSIEADIAALRNDGRELFRDGDLQAVLRISEQISRLDRLADETRREIVGSAVSEGGQQMTRRSDAEMVERVANQKGQEWGWSWDWGFPRPFDHDSVNASDNSEEARKREWLQLDAMMRLQSEARRLAAEFDEKAWDDPTTEVAKFNNYTASQSGDDRPRVWSWSKSWQWPPPADASQVDGVYSPRALEQNREMDKAGVPWRAAYEDLLRAEQNERPNGMRSDGSSSHTRLGQKIPISQRQLEESVNDDNEAACPVTGMWGRSKIPISHQQLEETMDRNDDPICPRAARQYPHDEPSYEYSHDHEDQHDDPPTPRREQFPFADVFSPEEVQWTQERRRQYTAQVERHRDAHDEDQESDTELDAYERLDAVSKIPTPHGQSRPISTRLPDDRTLSILSTLTTTERSVAPDGSVTTKVVLKKRFADGREESSETVHTQRGHEDDQARDPWKAFHSAQSSNKTGEQEEQKKKNGWFWSS